LRGDDQQRTLVSGQTLIAAMFELDNLQIDLPSRKQKRSNMRRLNSHSLDSSNRGVKDTSSESNKRDNDADTEDADNDTASRAGVST
jgi:hypothetical protein